MNDEIFASHFVTTFAQLEPLAQIEDMNDSFISSIHARKTVHILKAFISSICAKKTFISSRRSYPWPVSSRSFISSNLHASIRSDHSVHAFKAFISSIHAEHSADAIKSP